MTEKQNASQTWAICLFSIGVFMAALDNGIISAALTTIIANNIFSISGILIGHQTNFRLFCRYFSMTATTS